MVFPDGIEYDRITDQYRTFRVNSFFSYIPVISKEIGHKKTGKFREKTKNSGLVLEAGLEPARPNGHKILSLACLPIPPLEQQFACTLTYNNRSKLSMSGRRDSNPRPRPWQGRALPAELLSRFVLTTNAY